MAVISLLIGCLAPATAASAAGAIDTSYGDGGIVRIAPVVPSGFYLSERPGEAAVAPDGSVYYAASVSRCKNHLEAADCWRTEATAVFRFRPDGAIVRSFGRGGALILAGAERPTTIRADERGRLLTISGLKGATVRRYLSSGAIDRRFGRDGKSGVPGIKGAGVLEPAGHGRILIGSSDFGSERTSAPNQEITLARLLPSGNLDLRFGRKGHVRMWLPGSPGSLTVSPKGAIYVGGRSCCKGFTPLSRISAAGRLDTRFDERARAAQAQLLGQFERPEERTLIPRDNGEIDVLGGSEDFSGRDESPGFALRLRSDGRPDPGYGAGGLQELPRMPVAGVAGRDRSTLALTETVQPEGPGQVRALRLLGGGAPDRFLGGLAGTAFPEGGSGSGLTALARGGAMAYVAGYRNCRESCPATPYLVRLNEPTPSRGSKHGGKQR